MHTLIKKILTLGVALLGYSCHVAADWAPVDGAVDIKNGRQIYNRIDRQFTFPTTITNNANVAIDGPLRLVITDSTTPPLSVDGVNAQGYPYYTIDQSIAANAQHIVHLVFTQFRGRIDFTVHLERFEEDADTTPPVITLLGDNPLAHEQATEFTDPGATANDDVDGPVAVIVTGTVGNDSGTYQLTYSASDEAGNTALATRDVIVKDTLPPEITLIGDNTIELTEGEEYTEEGATAFDLVDGELTVSIDGEVASQAGEYTLTYRATDLSDNVGTATRVVTVLPNNNTIELNVLYNAA